MLKLRLDIFKREAALFTAIQGLALFAASRLRLIQPVAKITPPTVADLALFLFYFLIATLFFLIFLRFSRRRSFLKLLWILAIASGLDIFFAVLMRPDFAALLAAGVAYLYWKVPTVEIHNAVLVLALPAIGALFGSQINPGSAAVLLAVFSVYDVIAVYGTKHMVRMAAAFLQENVVPGIILSEKQSTEAVMVNEVTPGAGFSILGSGDLVFPSVLAVSAYLLRPLVGIVVVIFSVAGLFLTHTIFFSQKIRRPMPALPPISGLAILGFLIGQAIFK